MHRTVIASIALTLVIVLGVLAGATLPSCDWRQRTAAGAAALIDCNADNLRDLVAELVPLAKQAVMAAIRGDGQIDTGPLREAARALRSDVGRCALATAVAILTAPPATDPAGFAPARTAIDGEALRAAVRAELGGATYRTSAGDV